MPEDFLDLSVGEGWGFVVYLFVVAKCKVFHGSLWADLSVPVDNVVIGRGELLLVRPCEEVYLALVFCCCVLSFLDGCGVLSLVEACRPWSTGIPAGGPVC